MRSEAAKNADFSTIRYAQCWEDADILLEGLDIKEGETVVSIASAGDNTLSLLTRNPSKVYAIDLNPSQIACLEIRMAAYQQLSYEETLELLGVTASERRMKLYDRIKHSLSDEVRAFWENNYQYIALGIVHVGKFERYFELFRNKVLPFIHSNKTVNLLLEGGNAEERKQFYNHKWNNIHWRVLFRVFFSRFVMGRLGRDKAFFKYVEGSVADKILERTKYAITELNPAENPYLHFILKGAYGNVLPHALRREHYDLIRQNIHKIEYRLQSLEDFLVEAEDHSIDAYNLSDIFEYISETEMVEIYNGIVRVSKKGARIAYWNMLAKRQCPVHLQEYIRLKQELSKQLFLQDKAFFYSDFRVEEYYNAN